jgi:hypothetical protein
MYVTPLKDLVVLNIHSSLMLRDVRSSDLRLLIVYPMVFSMESHQIVLMYVITIILSIILTYVVSVLSTKHVSCPLVPPQPLW